MFEALIWLVYVAFYKYSYHIENSTLPKGLHAIFPYPELCLYSLISTIYLIPYYRWALPTLLFKKRYWILLVITLLYFIFITTLNNIAIAWLFAQFLQDKTVYVFFKQESYGFFMDWNMIMTDFIAFVSIGLARFSYQNELLRHKVETDHLNIQLTLLKNQLQPHFLFNTLNSLYGMSLTNSKETPRFILLLSNMMQYILYDCEQQTVSLKGEIDFLTGYFELEQKKFPNARITFSYPEMPEDIHIPPLLFLPLVENSFKHGRHRVENGSKVSAELYLQDRNLVFKINNDIPEPNISPTPKAPGGIGLVNIKKRLELYYPQQHSLKLLQGNNNYRVELSLTL